MVPIHDPENLPRVARRIRKLWDSENVRFTEPHSLERMDDQDLDVLDVENVIHDGEIIEYGQQESGLWRYTMEGCSIAGKDMHVVVEIDGLLIIVTVYLVD